MSRANQWFVPGEGIAREVITADIQRYLGPDALVRPGPGTGEFEGRSGYWITAYRTLTSQMIQDLKLDSQRWQQEQGRQEAGRGVAYQDSRTHAARQHWGPTESLSSQGGGREREPVRPSHSSSQYASSDHYTTAPATGYASSHSAPYPVQASPYAQQPRTQPQADQYAQYAQPGRAEPSGYAGQQSQYQYSQAAAPADPYRQHPPPPTHGYTTPSPVAAPGYYYASDGRQYPLAQQPQQPQQPRQSSGRSGRPT